MHIAKSFRIGVISDTHGLLREEALALLDGSDHIIHAGDIGAPEIVERLSAIAPTTAIRGNNDTEPWAMAFPEETAFGLAGRSIYLVHSVKDLRIDPAASGIDIVVAGHSHRPSVEMRGTVLFLNPGSAGPRRFSLPLSVALIEVTADHAAASILMLDLSASKAKAGPAS